MARPHGFKPADLGGEPSEVVCSPAYRPIEIDWSAPEPWGAKDEVAPVAKAQKRPGYLYAISWGHHRAIRQETIAYIGITNNLEKRFRNHATADALRARKRKTYLSVGHIDFGQREVASTKAKWITEQLEHILIWTLWESLLNDRKMYGMPGFGTGGGDAWHITNTGHKFGGQMPSEIIYPWILVKPRHEKKRSD